MADRPLEDAVDEYQKTGRIVAKTGLVNLSGAATPLTGTRVFVEGEQDRQRRAAPKIKRDAFLGMTLAEQCKVDKWCDDCKQYYPATADYWHADFKGLYALYFVCIDCRRIRDQKRYDLEQRGNMRVLLENTSSPKT